MRFSLLLFCALLFVVPIRAQVYFEPIHDTLTRFFFDENYYLVDKNCDFKSIERVIGFDKTSNSFHGAFKDFAPSGHPVLTGSYVHGKKEGVFRAYYPDQKVKWETTFKNDIPDGEWKYYHPDSKPSLTITLEQKMFVINSLQDRRGLPLITNGEGKYELEIPIPGFTEHGFLSYKWLGFVQNGKPEGRWVVSLMMQDEAVEIGTMVFQQGEIIHQQVDRGIFRDYYGSMKDLNDFHLTYSDYFPRAETLQTKRCTFDEFTGFSGFLMTKFSRHLTMQQGKMKVVPVGTVKYQVAVSKKGKPSIQSISYPPDQEPAAQKIIANMLKGVKYYLPSYLHDAPISDLLNVSLDIHYQNNSFSVSNLQIIREKGL